MCVHLPISLLAFSEAKDTIQNICAKASSHDCLGLLTHELETTDSWNVAEAIVHVLLGVAEEFLDSLQNDGILDKDSDDEEPSQPSLSDAAETPHNAAEATWIRVFQRLPMLPQHPVLSSITAQYVGVETTP